MTDDTNLNIASNFIVSGTPFIVFKPDIYSFDAAIPYLSKVLNLNLIKIGVHDLGVIVKEFDALYLVKSVVEFVNDKETLIWVEDISTVDDKVSFVKKVSEMCYTKKHIHLVFSGIRKYCTELDGIIPMLEWDKDYYTNNINFTYILRDRCTTSVFAPQDLHFRVYSNIVTAINQLFSESPIILIRNMRNRVAPIDSCISTSLLGIKTGELVKITTSGNYTKHLELMGCIMSGWRQPIKCVYGGLYD